MRVLKQHRWTVRTSYLFCALVAQHEGQEAEVNKRDSILGLLRAQLELLRHRQHGASSEKIDWEIEQFELIPEEIEASRTEAEMRSRKAPLPELETHRTSRSANHCPIVLQPKSGSMRRPALTRPVVAHRSWRRLKIWSRRWSTCRCPSRLSAMLKNA